MNWFQICFTSSFASDNTGSSLFLLRLWLKCFLQELLILFDCHFSGFKSDVWRFNWWFYILVHWILMQRWLQLLFIGDYFWNILVLVLMCGLWKSSSISGSFSRGRILTGSNGSRPHQQKAISLRRQLWRKSCLIIIDLASRYMPLFTRYIILKLQIVLECRLLQIHEQLRWCFKLSEIKCIRLMLRIRVKVMKNYLLNFKLTDQVDGVVLLFQLIKKWIDFNGRLHFQTCGWHLLAHC